jgi:hypothetical protein
MNRSEDAKSDSSNNENLKKIVRFESLERVDWAGVIRLVEVEESRK